VATFFVGVGGSVAVGGWTTAEVGPTATVGEAFPPPQLVRNMLATISTDKIVANIFFMVSSFEIIYTSGYGLSKSATGTTTLYSDGAL
jgi:hypothetical protein